MSASIPQVESSFGFLLTEKQEELLTGYKVDQARENYRYLKKHPEIKMFINLLLKAVLFEQPQKVRQFLYTYIQDNFNEIKSLFEPETMSLETGDPKLSILLMNKWRNKYKSRHSGKVSNLSSVDNSQRSMGSNIPTTSKVAGDFGFYKILPQERLIKSKSRSDRIKGDQTSPRLLSKPKSIIDSVKLVCPIPQEKFTCINIPRINIPKSIELGMFSQNYDGGTSCEFGFNRVSGIAVQKNIPDFGFYGDQMKRKAEEKKLQDEYCIEHQRLRENLISGTGTTRISSVYTSIL